MFTMLCYVKIAKAYESYTELI